MIIYNPHTEEVSITYQGVSETIAPGEEKKVTDAFGRFWITTHAFLDVIVESTDVVAPIATEEVVVEEAVVEEAATEVIEEAPAVEVVEVVEEEAPAPKKAAKKTAKKTK